MKKIINAFSKYSYSRKNLRSVILFFLGLAALIWFLIRVIPKPSRAAYPCMQAAFVFMLTSTSIKFTPVIARAYTFSYSLLGNSLPVMNYPT
jgi:uncharacterized BrkB/YihY/UPF0761 family membrane protein